MMKQIPMYPPAVFVIFFVNYSFDIFIVLPLMYAYLTYHFALPVRDYYTINIMCVFLSGLHFG